MNSRSWPILRFYLSKNPDFKILVAFKILSFQNPEFKILAVQNVDFKILTDYKI